MFHAGGCYSGIFTLDAVLVVANDWRQNGIRLLQLNVQLNHWK